MIESHRTSVVRPGGVVIDAVTICKWNFDRAGRGALRSHGRPTEAVSTRSVAHACFNAHPLAT